MSPTAAYNAYKKQDASRWTRVELLLELYDRSIAALERARDAELQSDESAFARELIEAQRFVAGLVAGLNPDAGELAERLRQAYLFVVRRIGAEDVASALATLRTLREGFEGIRAEAIALECSGAFPDLRGLSAVQLDV